MHVTFIYLPPMHALNEKMDKGKLHSNFVLVIYVVLLYISFCTIVIVIQFIPVYGKPLVKSNILTEFCHIQGNECLYL